MTSLFKNQRNLFLLTVGRVLIIIMSWYYGYQRQFSINYAQTKSSIDNLSKKKNSYSKKKNTLQSIEDEWGLLNDEFQIILTKYPKKQVMTKSATHFIIC